jgi:ABC-type phosphate transport system auxiliary subunit
MQSKNKIQTQPIEDFIARVRTAKAKQDKNINLTMQDADRLAASLSQTMTRLVSVQEEIIEALKTAQQAQTINIEMDGGNFSANNLSGKNW